MRHVLRHHRLLSAALIGAGVFAVLAALRLGGVLEPLELAAYDWQLRLRARNAPPVERIVVVGVTEDDIRRLGTWPVPHGVLAQALGNLARLDPVAIGLDIYLDVPVPPGRDALDALLEADDRIVTVMKVGDGAGTRIEPAPVLAGSERVGFTDTLLDRDATVRRALLFLDDGESFSVALSLQLALRYLEPRGIAPAPDPEHPEWMRLGPVTFVPLEGYEGGYQGADAGGYQILIDYREPPARFPQLSLSELLAGTVRRESVAGKLVLFGVTADSVKDLFFTPHRAASGARQTPGVVVHAHVASQLLRAGLEGDRPLGYVNDFFEMLWLLVWAVAGALLAVRVRSLWVLGVIAAGGVLVLGGIGTGAFRANLWLPVVPPVLGWLGAIIATGAYVASVERQERRSLMSLFSKHVSPQLAGAIWEQRESFLSEEDRPLPQRLTATTFFSDVASFTTISERLEPAALMGWLNEYMALMSPCINEHNGVILRFIGDAIMAVFGVPVPRASDAEIREDALNAVRCAVAMRERLCVHNADLERRGLPLIGMRIGILTGPMVAGTIGSRDRLEYNVHGDTVNTAARLESFQKETFEPDYLRDPCRILIGAATAEHVGDAFDLERVGEVSLKGKANRVAVYSVRGPRGAVPSAEPQLARIGAV